MSNQKKPVTVKDIIEVIQEPDFDDVEVQDVNDVLERLDFIVPQTDDPSTPTFTFRAVTIGVIWCLFLSFVNTLLSFRTNSFGVGANVALILSYPIGLAWHATFTQGGFLNPGPFNVKEHTLIYLLAACGTGTPYGLDNVIVQVFPDMMNNSNITMFHSIAFCIVTQFLGYGMSGLIRRFLVKPTAMWWPGNLGLLALLTSFHKVETGQLAGNKFKTSRFQAFWFAFAFMFAWTWIPEFFMPVLQAVSTLCLFSGVGVNSNGTPNKAGVMTTFNAVAGSVYNGVGIFGTTFDWAYIGSSNMLNPFWANAVNAVGTVVIQWIVVPILWANDTWEINKYISSGNTNPILNANGLYNGNPNSTTHALGQQVRPVFFYNVSNNYNLNLTAYNDVEPIHLTVYFAVTYASSFLTITAALSHVLIWYGSDIYRQAMNAFRQIQDEVDGKDKHVQLMEAYPEVPDWAYLAFLGVTTLLGIFVSVFTPFNMPWWAIFFNLFVCAIFILPFGVIQAISGFGLGLNVLTEFAIGLMIPGQTVAVMAFKSWGTNNLLQALTLASDLKLGQYLHVAPYALVTVQFLGTFINAIISVIVAYYLMFNAGHLLGTEDWNYINYKTFYSAGGIWGAIGPQRFFGIGSIYENLLWCFLIGAISPILPWLGNKFIVKSKYWHWINFPLIYTIPGSGGLQNGVVCQMTVAFISQVFIFDNHREFYQKYNYVIGTAFDASSGIAALVISILGIYNIVFLDYNVFNPAKGPDSSSTSDYYCYPDRGYLDYGCEYYLKQGQNITSLGVSCLEAA